MINIFQCRVPNLIQYFTLVSMLMYDEAYTVNMLIYYDVLWIQSRTKAHAAENGIAARNKCARDQTKRLIKKDVSFQC